MSNVDRPNGFKPVGTLTGSPWQSGLRLYQADGSGSNLFPGDMVILEADGCIDIATSASLQLLGVMVGKLLNNVNTTTGLVSDGMLSNSDPVLTKKYYDTADGAGWILVATDPNTLYEVQADGTTPYTAIGSNCDILATAGSTLTGRSQQEISSTVATATTSGIRIVALSQKPNNDVTAANSKWIVKINDGHFTGVPNLGV